MCALAGRCVKEKMTFLHFLYNPAASLASLVLYFGLMANFAVGFLSLPFIFGLWFILCGIGDLAFGGRYSSVRGPLTGLNLVANILRIILGVMMLTNPLSSYFTLVFIVGTYFVISGIRYLVNAFA